MKAQSHVVHQLLEEDCAIRSAKAARDYVVRCLSPSEIDDAIVVVIYRLGPLHCSRIAEIFGAERRAMDDIVHRLIKTDRLRLQMDSTLAISHISFNHDGEVVLP